MMSASIRAAAGPDREGIRGIHLRAFPEGENRLVATLATDLLDEVTLPATIALVAEIGDDMVGHIAFSPVTADSDRDWLGYILAPLAVKPGYHKVGIGSQLIERGIELVSREMADVLFVYGDPKYYGRFGFRAEAAARFVPPYELKYPFGWQALMLHEGGSNDRAVKLSCVRSLRDPAVW
jgi:putative acetyltransferase